MAPRPAAIALALSTLATPLWGQVTVTAGFEYLSGDYGKARSTEEWRIPLAVGYRTGAWNFRLSVPLTRVEGIASAIEAEARGSNDGNFIGDDADEDNDGVLDADDADDDNDGVSDDTDADDDNDGIADADDDDDDADGIPDEFENDDADNDDDAAAPALAAAASPARPAAGPSPGRTLRDRRQSGVGDVTVSAFYTLLDAGQSPLGLELGARIKLPAASGKKCYLTNGETDYSVQANLYQSFGKLEPYASIGWTKRGDPDRRNADCVKIPGASIDLRNPFYAALGIGYRLSDVSTVRLEYEFREKLRSSSDPKSEARLLFQRRLSDTWRLGVFASAGFSDNSPDWGAGATLSYRFR